jgi:hypothetical protein
MQVGDDGVTFASSLGGEEEAQGEPAAPKTLTAEEKLVEAEAKLAKYKSLDFLADALERDPSRIHDFRDAAEGKRREPSLTEQPVHRQQPTGPKTLLEAVKAMTPEKRAELEAMDQIEREAAMADLAQQMSLNTFADASRPIIDATVMNAINAFKLSRSSEPIAPAAAKYFDAEMGDFDRSTFYQLSEAQRTRQLELRWNSAKAKAYDAAAAKATPRSPRNLGAGGAGGGTPMRQPSYKASAELNELIARSGLKPEQAARILKEVAAEG